MEGDFRIDLGEACDINDGEEEVAEFQLDGGLISEGQALAKLGQFLFDLGQHILDPIPIEPDSCDFFLQLGGAQEGGELFGDAGCDGITFQPLFFGLDALPLRKHLLGGMGLGIAEDVGVTMDELIADRLRDGVEIEPVTLPCDLSVEDDLEENVAEFFDQVRVIPFLDRFDHFIGFFDQVRGEGLVRLFVVPGATSGSAKRGHNRHEPADRVGNGLDACETLRWGFRCGILYGPVDEGV